MWDQDIDSRIWIDTDWHTWVSSWSGTALDLHSPSIPSQSLPSEQQRHTNIYTYPSISCVSNSVKRHSLAPPEWPLHAERSHWDGKTGPLWLPPEGTSLCHHQRHLAAAALWPPPPLPWDTARVLCWPFQSDQSPSGPQSCGSNKTCYQSTVQYSRAHDDKLQFNNRILYQLCQHLSSYPPYLVPLNLPKPVFGQLLIQLSRVGGWHPVDITLCEETLLLTPFSTVVSNHLR